MTTTPVERALSVLRPDLLDEWHTGPNAALGYDPARITVGSSLRAWWLCSTCGYEWQTRVAHRANGSGCPACAGLVATPGNNLAAANPDWLSEWDHPRNNADDVDPADLLPRSNRKVWWRCSTCSWRWQASPDTRSKGHGCPACAGLVATPDNNLTVAAPDWLSEWDTDRNDEDGITPADVLPQSNRRVWWVCPANREHRYDASPAARHRGKGCPYCAGRRVDDTNSLAAVYPFVSADWHPVLNGDLTPNDVTAGSSRVVWWRCPVSPDHDWETPVGSRTTNGAGCPTCAGKRPGTHNRLDLNAAPDLLTQWHPTRNGDQTPADYTVGSNQPAWWQCTDCSHEWEARIVDRTGTRPTGCPRCAPSPDPAPKSPSPANSPTCSPTTSPPNGPRSSTLGKPGPPRSTPSTRRQGS